MRLFTLIAIYACMVLSTQSLFAQHSDGCGFDIGHHKLMQTNPAYKAAVERQESAIRAASRQIQNGRFASGIYYMPVVVHIVHTGGLSGSLYNPTDLQIQNVITYLNNVYKGIDPGQNGEGVGDMGVQFELAKRDPNCNPTNGINHIDGSSLAGYSSYGVNLNNTNGATELSVKNLMRWDATKYCNIWVVNKIDGIDGVNGGGTSGFAYFPFDPTIDGVVIRAADMIAGNTTLPHEMGHTFTLYHPFEGSGPTGTTCPTNTNPATQGDMISDTDPVTNPSFANPERTGNTNPCIVSPATLYKIETEHNIMSYVINPRLFTSGQKTRMLAAITSGTYGTYRINQVNSNGDIAPDAGTVCPLNKLDFELSEYRIAEQTAGNVVTGGCTRYYKDYTFNMLIGKSPSATATVTLSTSGATEGVDFDITTNGSFTAASKTIAFPTGSAASHAFTVRVYDDASVTGSKTLVVGFSTSGGDAIKGDGNPNLSIIITDNDAAPHVAADIEYGLGGSGLYTATSPFAGATAKTKSQMIYKAAELTAAGIKAGNFKSVSFYVITNNTAGFTYQNFNVKIASTAQQHIVNSNVDNSINDLSHLVVYSGNVTLVDGWNTLTFSTPFAWNGTSNIVVTTCYDNGSTIGADDYTSIYSDGSYNEQDGDYVSRGGTGCTNALALPGYYLYGNKPIIRFVATDPETTVNSTLNASRSEYLGPNADVYFYDASTSQLMARIKNLTSFNYGCTQVVIDRSGTGATAFQSSTTSRFLMNKTFRVLPTTNNTSGQYEITLYYTQPEVAGWQSATGQSFSSIQLVKVPNQIKDASPATPNGAGTPLQVDPVRGTLGSSYSLSYTFSTGFSGFGAGVNAVVLPVRLTDLSAVISGNDINVNWKTSSELNSRQFDLERSYDGTLFTKIATIAASGNSTTGSQYLYKDLNYTGPVNYYRLRIIDLDGTTEYSKIVMVRATGTSEFFAALNPVQQDLHLVFGNITGGTAEIRLTNISGQVVQRWKGTISKGQRLNVPLNSNIVSGIYTVQVVLGNQQFIKKVIKE